MPSFFEYTRGKDTIQIAKLEGPRNWDTWRADIQSLLETEGVWEVTTGEDPKPTKPPRPRHTCAPQQQLYRNACEDYMDRLHEWEEKSTYAFVWITFTCEEALCEYISEHEYGQIAFMLLKELYEPIPPSDNPGLNAAVKTPLYSLAHELADNCSTVAEVVWKVPLLMRRCAEMGYSIPEWMKCYFFQSALDLTAEERLKLHVAKAEKGLELTIEDIVEVLGEDREVGS